MQYSFRDRTTHLVVHSAATRADADIGRAEIEQWHRKRGFLTVGYHFIIRRDGTVEEGRPVNAVGAHSRGSNQYSIGVCMAGGVAADGVTPENNFTPAQFDALFNLIGQMKLKYGPFLSVVGHRDMPGQATACPSFDVAAWYDAELNRQDLQ